MTIPTEQDFLDGKVDLDDLEKIVNLFNTVTTRIGGDKLSVDQALSQIIVGDVAAYNPGTQYTTIEQWITQGGAMYRPLPSALPIGPEAFDSAKWSPVNGLNLANISGNIDGVAISDMNQYLNDLDARVNSMSVANYAALRTEMVNGNYTDNTYAVVTNENVGGLFRIYLDPTGGTKTDDGVNIITQSGDTTAIGEFYAVRVDVGATKGQLAGVSATADDNTAAIKAGIAIKKSMTLDAGTYNMKTLANFQGDGVVDLKGLGHATTINSIEIPASDVSAKNTSMFFGAVGSSDRVITRLHEMSFTDSDSNGTGFRASAVQPFFGDYLRAYKMGGRAFELNSIFYGAITGFELFESGMHFTRLNNYTISKGDIHGEDAGGGIYSNGVAITGITQANPGVISTATTPKEGQIVYIEAVVGMTQVNLKSYRAGTVVAGVSFVPEILSSGVTTFSSGTTYTSVDSWVSEGGNVYQPKAASLPIGPGAFNASQWWLLEASPTGYKLNTSDFGAYTSGGSWYHNGNTLNDCDGVTISDTTIENWDSCTAFLVQECKSINFRDVWLEANRSNYTFRFVNTTDVSFTGRYIDCFEAPGSALISVNNDNSNPQRQSTQINVNGGMTMRLRDDDTLASGSFLFVDVIGNSSASLTFNQCFLSQGYILLHHRCLARVTATTLGRSDWSDDEKKFLESVPVARTTPQGTNTWVPNSTQTDPQMSSVVVTESTGVLTTVALDSTFSFENQTSTKITIPAAVSSKIKYQHTMGGTRILSNGHSMIVFVRCYCSASIPIDFSLEGDFGNLMIIPQLTTKTGHWIDYVLKPSAAGSWSQGRFNDNKVNIELTNNTGADLNFWIDRIDYKTVEGDIFLP